MFQFQSIPKGTIQKGVSMSSIRYICSYQSPLGPMTMASDGEALTGLWFDGQKYDRAGLKGKEVKEISETEAVKFPVFVETTRWLDIYFGKVQLEEEVVFRTELADQPDFTPPLKVEGSEFRQLVAESMLTIPYGQTMTYGEIGKEAAKRMGKKSMSAQAVGGAVGHNPISVIIPCHRVLGANGSLTGYAGGIEKKMRLLEMETGKKYICL